MKRRKMKIILTWRGNALSTFSHIRRIPASLSDSLPDIMATVDQKSNVSLSTLHYNTEMLRIIPLKVD